MSTRQSLGSSPGNDYSERTTKMRVPSMKFIYRLECEMAKENHVVGAPMSADSTRIIMPIVGGTVKGPQISAVIQHMSGADWGLAIGKSGVRLLSSKSYFLLTDLSSLVWMRDTHSRPMTDITSMFARKAYSNLVLESHLILTIARI